jgi:hypothetical protein
MTAHLLTRGHLLRGALFLTVCALGAGPAATAATAATTPSKAPPQAASKAAPKAGKKAPAKPVDTGPAAATPEQTDAAEKVYYGVYDCEFNQKVGIEKSPKHPAYVDVRSGKSAWLMKPVLSSTGAIRLEDVKGETLMVQIASKSMLLNVKTARRIVDDCVSPSQLELVEAGKVDKVEAEAAARTAEPPKPGEAASQPAAAEGLGIAPPRQ